MMQVLVQHVPLQQRGGGQSIALLLSPSSLHCDTLLSFARSSFLRYSLQWTRVRRLGRPKFSSVLRSGGRGTVVRMSSSRRSGGSKTVSSENSFSPAATAKEAVETGLSFLQRKALKLSPEPEEAQAALYNKACCHACREEGEKAAKALRPALRDYGLKFSVILNDSDMAPFRAMPEFKQLQDEARKGGADIGQSFRRDFKLISEVQAPFRGVRKFFYAAFTLAAGLSTLFTIPRLVLAIQRGEGAPDVITPSQNLAEINLGEKPEPIKKRGFGSSEKPPPESSLAGRAADVAAKAIIQSERRFKAEAVSSAEWERWIRDQQQSEGVTPGKDVYIVLRLDGRVRKSGVGMPDWQGLISELPPLDTLISKLEK